MTQRTPLQSANDRATGRCAEVGAADANPKIHGERRSDTARSGKEPVSGLRTGKTGTNISTRNPNTSAVCFGAAPTRVANLPVQMTGRFLEVILHV